MLRMTIATAALLLASPAMAQELTAAQRDACMGDFGKFCKGTVPGGGGSSPASANTMPS